MGEMEGTWSYSHSCLKEIAPNTWRSGRLQGEIVSKNFRPLSDLKDSRPVAVGLFPILRNDADGYYENQLDHAV